MKDGASEEPQLPIPSPNYEVIREAGAQRLLHTVRPVWRARRLIERVERLLLVDPSSACQRIFNAAIQDLREKLFAAGLDIVGEIATQNKLPPVQRREDIDDYSTFNVIELAYRVGLVSRAESRRLFRAYDIRGDLEHEDDDYEATVEDCVYVFKTCVESVLSRDPVEILRVADVKKLVEQPARAVVSEGVVEDFKRAPAVRQLEIHKFLISYALDKDLADVVRENAYTALNALRPATRNEVLLDSATEYVKRIGRAAPDLLHARVAFASGVLPYLKRPQLREFFLAIHAQMEEVGHTFRSHASHREMLRNLEDVGGLEHCPDDVRARIVEWLILLYVGEPGGYGAGWNRRVFYSNVGAPLGFAILKASAGPCRGAFEEASRSNRVRAATRNSDVARRFEGVADLFAPE